MICFFLIFEYCDKYKRNKYQRKAEKKKSGDVV